MASNFLKLISLSIKGYKNIKDLEIDFEDKKGITVLIGKNGCGKSHVLEALSSIFAGLYSNLYEPSFNYAIRYEITGKEVEIQKEGKKYKFKVDNKPYVQTKKDVSLLPKNVIACYSGDNLRLWNDCYWPYYNDYISTIKNAESIPELPMLYINRYNLTISLLLLFFYDFEVFTDVKEFCNNTLKIQAISKIKFTFNLKKIREWKENLVIQMVKSICNINNISELSKDTIELTTIQLRERLEYMEQREFFKMMYAATMPKEDKIIIDISFDILLNNGATISLEDLSEGEQKNLLMFVILETIADENSLLLFDEPDSHIHISRKAQLKELFEKYSNRENIMTTHSPTLAVKFEGHIEGLGLDTDGHTVRIDCEKAKLVSSITGNMWNVHEQNMFLASNKQMTLLVEGKTDKIHIEEAFKHLKGNFPLLDFDVYSMNSCEHIREVLIGLSCSEIVWKKQFVGILDNDDAGQQAIKSGFEKEASYATIKHVKYKEGTPSKSFYAFLLPKKQGYDDKGFTIENCYDASKYEDAFCNALEEKKGHFSGLSIDTISANLRNKSKTILADKAKTFIEDDFEGFKPIFELLDEIRNLKDI